MLWLVALAMISAGIALRRGVPLSRRVLACALAVLLPGVGIGLAILVRRVGGGAIAAEPPRPRPVERLSPVDVVRLGELPPALDRLLAGDPSERLEALVALSSAADAHAVRILRWTIEHGPSDAVLDAALTLEEIDLRSEAGLVACREALESRVSGERALAAGDAAARPLFNRIADAALTSAFAAQARRWYRLALDHAPERAPEILEKAACLELAAGCPADALELLDCLSDCDGVDPGRLLDLQDDAAFAARAFDRLSFVPTPLDVPRDFSAACKRAS